MHLKKVFDSLPPFFRRQKIARLLLRLSPGSKIQLVEFNNNARLYADISDSFPLSYFLTRSYGSDFLCVAAAFLKKGGTYFDVGANFGFCTFGLLGLIPDAPIHYYLIEANREMIPCLHRSAELYPNASIKIFEGAAARQSGTSRLNVIPRHTGSSFISQTSGENVTHIVLDDLIRREGIRRIDVMKMDIEGSEPAALQGCSESLMAGIVKVLYFEVTQETLSRYHWSIDAFLKLIRSYGFEVFFVRPVDFERIAGLKGVSRTIRIHDETLTVAPVTDYPESLETDLLAIHKSFFPE